MIVIGIAGGTGSGKTTVATAVLERVLKSKTSVKMLSMDSYYRNLDHLPLEEREKTNFDHPDSLETELLVEHVQMLKNGKAVHVPIYDFEHHRRKEESLVVESPQVLILEGILLFVDPKLRALIDVKVFVEASADLRFIRRMKRDVNERGRSIEQICSQYLQTVREMHEHFVEPTKSFADIIVPNFFERDYAVIVDLLASRAILADQLASPSSEPERKKRLKNAD